VHAYSMGGRTVDAGTMTTPTTPPRTHEPALASCSAGRFGSIRFRSAALAAALSLSVHAALPADQSEPHVLTPDAAVEIALRDNARLAAMRANVDAMRERPAQAGALPNPVLIYGMMGTQDDLGLSEADETRIGFEQGVPWFGKRILRARIAGKDAEAMEGEYEAMRREIAAMAAGTCYELDSMDRAIAIAKSQEEILQRMEKTAQTKYAAGSVDQQDVIKAQAEITMLRQKVIGMEQEREVLRAKLARLLNRNSFAGRIDTAVPRSSAPLPDLPALIEKALLSRAELAAEKARLERSELESRLMAREYYPDMKFGVETRFVRGGGDMIMAMAGIELPVWAGRNRAGVRGARKATEAGRASMDAAARDIEYEVREAYEKLASARRILDLHEQALLPQARARFAASEAGYRAGEADFMDLLESERFLLDVSIMEVMTERDVGMHRAALERAVGGGLSE